MIQTMELAFKVGGSQLGPAGGRVGEGGGAISLCRSADAASAQSYDRCEIKKVSSHVWDKIKYFFFFILSWGEKWVAFSKHPK